MTRIPVAKLPSVHPDDETRGEAPSSALITPLCRCGHWHKFQHCLPTGFAYNTEDQAKEQHRVKNRMETVFGVAPWIVS
ncbi:hypothetical protein PAPYR_11245 [Paratrimastix pyriformis]|uniref:Uncharacterized protein n=1 Tax=Paratrimastix pyriformis TaxID=342808 RepID=A0ABQ8U9Y6_9EUKA|nr:hypothetical protein PAPYR_11245 [Paratrimastix pyriformis]